MPWRRDLGRVAAAPSAAAAPPAQRPRQPSARRRQRDPGQQRVAELAHEVLEGAAIAVAADDHAAASGCRRTARSRTARPWRISIAWCHGTATTRAARRSDTTIAVARAARGSGAPVPGERQVGEEHDHRQPQPREPLGQHRQAAQRSPRCTGRAAPCSGCAPPAATNSDEAERCTASSRRRRTSSRRGRRHGITSTRAAVESITSCGSATTTNSASVAVEERVVGPAQILRRRRAPRAAAAARRVVEQRQRAQRQRHRHRPDERHVGHRLARDQAVQRRTSRARPPPARPRAG